jgi:energy-converting hydrogenase Eha subunit E
MARRITWPELPPNVVLVATPLVGALASWLLAVILGDAPGASGMDPVAAALLLCGPIAGLAVFLAYNRWPRLAGLSSVSAMIALLLVARALIG